MATTNEDAAILASARLDDGRMLVLRHLPDRGTIEVGFWGKDAGAVVLQPPALEIAAEAAELDALASLCGRAPAGEGGEGAELAAAGPFADGARLSSSRSGDGVRWPAAGARQPPPARRSGAPGPRGPDAGRPPAGRAPRLRPAQQEGPPPPSPPGRPPPAPASAPPSSCSSARRSASGRRGRRGRGGASQRAHRTSVRRMKKLRSSVVATASLVDRRPEARPAGAGLVLGLAREQRLAAADADVGAGRLVFSVRAR